MKKAMPGMISCVCTERNDFMIRKWVALCLLLVAVGGLVVLLIGATTTHYTVHTRHVEAEYDIAEDKILSSRIIASTGSENQDQKNLKDELKDVHRIAAGMHSTPIWIGSVVLFVFGLASLITWKSIRYY